jgi:hypothetical protein
VDAEVLVCAYHTVVSLPDVNWVSFLGAQAFKIIVTDPDSVLGGLTKEVKEEGPDGQEVGNGFRIA